MFDSYSHTHTWVIENSVYRPKAPPVSHFGQWIILSTLVYILYGVVCMFIFIIDTVSHFDLLPFAPVCVDVVCSHNDIIYTA